MYSNSNDEMDEDYKDSGEKHSQSSRAYSNSDFEKDFMEEEEIEEKIDAKSSKRSLSEEEEEKKQEVSFLQTYSAWKGYNTMHDGITGTFHIHNSLKQEHDQRIQAISTKKPTKKRQKAAQGSRVNQLFCSPSNYQAQAYQSFIPNTITYTFEGIGSRIYNAKFSQNGESLLVTSQTGTAVFDYFDDNKIRLNKTITCLNVNWAITDSDFTQDNKLMIHSTLSPYIQIFDVENKKYIHQINVNQESQISDYDGFWYGGMRVFSAKISADGKEIIAGTSRTANGSAKLQIYDLAQNKITRSIDAHDNDINSVCFVDKLNSSLVITGSDDVLCKLWDIRAFNGNRPAGIFYGHMGGMTNVCSKEDNRYFISNCKDQSIKLWDLRKSSTEKKSVSTVLGVDYRRAFLDEDIILRIKERMKLNKDDSSVATYFGHQVRGTLIRCHFSPRLVTDQRFIYSGSADGYVYIYDILSGENVAKLEMGQGQIIRDCAWHPFSQNIITTDFEGNVCRWEYFDVEEEGKVVKGASMSRMIAELV